MSRGLPINEALPLGDEGLMKNIQITLPHRVTPFGVATNLLIYL
jgi:hypothetical protein